VDFDQELLDLAVRLKRWRNAALQGLCSKIYALYSDSPVDEQDDFERGREHGLNQVLEIINKILHT